MNPASRKPLTATAIRPPRSAAEAPTTRAKPIAPRLTYSIREVSAITGLGRSLIYQEIAAGRLLIKKAGRRSLVFDADLKSWLASLPAK